MSRFIFSGPALAAFFGAAVLLITAGPVAAAQTKCQPPDQKLVQQDKPGAAIKLSTTAKDQKIAGTVELAEAGKQACAPPQPEDHKALGKKEAARDE